jgi:endonuclease YncB( thermonuclease family)
MKRRGDYATYPRWVFPVCDYRVLDGDTVEVDLDLNFGLTKQIHIRLTGIDTPELRNAAQAAAGKVAKAAIYAWLTPLFQAGRLMCEPLEEDKYGSRWIGDFFDLNHPTSTRASQWMLSAGYAKVYTGGTKTAWTESELSLIVSKGPPADPGPKGPRK